MAEFLRTAQEKTQHEGVNIDIDNLEAEITRRNLNPCNLKLRIIKRKMIETLIYLASNGNVECILEKENINIRKGFFEYSLIGNDEASIGWVMFLNQDEVILSVA